MKENFDKSMEYIFQYEGGYALKSTEPGGSVNKGVTMQTLRIWHEDNHFPAPDLSDIQSLSDDVAIKIYHKYYAPGVAFDDLPAGVDFCVFDSGINDGVGAATRLLAGVLGHSASGQNNVKPDLVSLARTEPADVLIDHFCDARIAYKKQSPNWVRFKNGWSNRIESVRQHAKEMAKGAVSDKKDASSAPQLHRATKDKSK